MIELKYHPSYQDFYARNCLKLKTQARTDSVNASKPFCKPIMVRVSPQNIAQEQGKKRRNGKQKQTTKQMEKVKTKTMRKIQKIKKKARQLTSSVPFTDYMMVSFVLILFKISKRLYYLFST